MQYGVRVESCLSFGNGLLGGVAEMPEAYQSMNMQHTIRGTYVIRSFRSFAFLRPPKAIFVPGMYFLGFSKYSYWYSY